MIPRMTTIGVLNNYRYDLNKSNNIMTKAMNTVMTGRSFTSYAEDPALATRCFQMRRSFLRTSSQLEVNTSTLSKYNQAWSCLDTVSQDIYDSTVTQNSTAFGSILRAENGADASGRNALGQSLSALARNIVQTMNGRNGENFIFGGADTMNAPFSWGPKVNQKNAYYVSEEELAEIEQKMAALDVNDDEYKEYAEKYAKAFQYVTADGKLTNDKAKAEFEVPNNYADAFDSFDDKAGVIQKIKDEAQAQGENLGDLDGIYLTENSELRSYTYEDDEGVSHTINYYTNTTSDPALADKDYRENAAYDKIYQYEYVTSNGAGSHEEFNEAEQGIYFRGVPVDSNEYEKNMEYFLGETKYLDIGLGHKEEGSQALSSTVFNSALQGIYYLGGYGTDENGVPNNLISIIDELGTILQRCDPDNGSYASDEDAARAEALAQKLEDQQEIFIQRYAEIDTKCSFLRDNGELLTDTADSLAEQFLGLEDVDPADAITAYMYARYCYDAALKLGNSVLPQSLMDYMNL